MKNIKGRTITEAQKSQIISESYKTGCIISQLAKSYGISVKTLYSWRSRQKSERIKKEVSNNSNNQFVELSVQNNENIVLNKAELIFNNFSLLLEGNIKSTKLLEIIKVLEMPC
ncbi:MAG: transposase [Rickettsia endosymbiont of Oxypoda opaca]|nr:transposase [Rickettsia endosymbiont of Oxypoda opaca]